CCSMRPPCYAVLVDWRGHHCFMERDQSGDRSWRATAEVWPGTVARGAVLVLMLAAPWIASNPSLAIWLWPPALLIFICWVLTPELAGRSGVSVPALLLPLTGAVAFGALQLAPMPSDVLKILSPQGQHWWSLVDAARR